MKNSFIKIIWTEKKSILTLTENIMIKGRQFIIQLLCLQALKKSFFLLSNASLSPATCERLIRTVFQSFWEISSKKNCEVFIIISVENRFKKSIQNHDLSSTLILLVEQTLDFFD